MGAPSPAVLKKRRALSQLREPVQGCVCVDGRQTIGDQREERGRILKGLYYY
jgi:hypothetical protein